MTTYPVDIRIDTGGADRSLSTLDQQLNATAKSAIDAAQAANSLTVSTDSVTKAAAALAGEQVKQLSRTISIAQSTRASAQASLDEIIAYRQAATTVEEANKYKATQLALQKVIINQSNIEITATNDLAQAQNRLSQAIAPIIRQQEQQKAAQQAAAEATRQQQQAAQQAARAAQQQKAVQDQLNKSNVDYVAALRQQVAVAKTSGLQQQQLINSSKLNSNATAEQRKEVERLTKELHNLKNAQEPAKTGIDGIVSAAKGFIALAVVQKVIEWGKAFVSTADEIQRLQARISSLADSQQDANNTFAELVKIANITGNTIQDTAGAYQQLYLSAKDAGVGSNEIVKLVSNLQKAAVISGTSSEGASRAIFQLSQAFSIGKLQGQDFKAMVQNMPITIKLMADALGISVGELRNMAGAGELGVESILKLNDATDKLNAEYEKTPRYVGDAANALKNNLAVAIDAINDRLGITAALATQLDGYAGVVDRVLKLATGTYTEYDELGKQVGIVAANIVRLKEASKGIDPNSLTGVNYQKEIANQQKVLTGLQNQKKGLDNLSKSANQLQEDLSKASAPIPKDFTADKELKKLKLQSELSAKSGLEQAKLAAVQKLGTKATQDQIKEAERLATITYNNTQAKKDDKKAISEQESAAKRAAKELANNQKANAKYIETLKIKVAADGLDLEATKIAIQLKKAETTASDNQVATIQKLLAAQQAYALAAQQKEAQSKLNKDATDAERLAVDQYVASLFKQQQAAQAAKDYADLTGALTTAAQSPLGAELSGVGAQEAQRYATLQAARDADLINEQEYQNTKTQIQEDAEKQRSDIMTAAQGMLLSASSDFFGASANLAKGYAGEQSGIYRGLFAASKAFAIAQASIALYQNVAEAMKYGFPANIPFIAGALAQGTAIMGQLSSVNFADGGYVKGRGTGRSDSVQANLSNGEFVSTAPATARYRNTLEAMNNGTYRENRQAAEPKVSVHNYGGDKIRVEKGATPDEVRVIVGEMVPSLMAGQIADPYSKSNKSLNNSYNMIRKN